MKAVRTSGFNLSHFETGAKAMKKVIILSSLISLLSLTAQADEKDFYARMEPKARLNLLGHMRVMKILNQNDPQKDSKAEDDKDNRFEKIDVVKYLSEKCNFNYTRDASGTPVRPQVNCVYKPRTDGDEFFGMSSKFDCTFTAQNSQGQVKEKTLKVKYGPRQYEGGGYKEIPQAFLGTSLARLLGFYTGTYCPVDLVCKDCPSEHPWAQNKSKAPAMPGSVIEFKNVVIEVKQKGYKIQDTKAPSDEPQGFSMATEMNRYFPKTDKESQLKLKAERDALTLWFNFVVSNDADKHNTKLLCVKSVKPADEKQSPRCELSVGMINDYGNSFGYKNGDTPLNISEFSRSALRGNQTTGADGDARAQGHVMSEEGRTLFVTMAEAITDQQLNDIFSLAQIQKVSNAGTEAWKQAFRSKVQKVKQTKFR
jgi:hypothetical protein